MLEKLKEMQKYGIFKLQPFDENLDEILVNAQKEEDLKEHLDSIKEYLKDLIYSSNLNYNVSIGKTLYDFNDKFSYEMYSLYLEPMNYTTRVYSKETNYGRYCGKGYIGLKSDNPVFTVYERKMLKIVNHYYISLSSNSKFNNDFFYIPISQLFRMFSQGINRSIIKNSIIDACDRLRSKKIYWNLTKTTYCKAKKLKEKKLHICNGESLIDIIPIYQIRGHALSLCGIICKVNNLLKLRYSFKQISSMFPSILLESDYLSVAIADKLIYPMNLKSNKKKGIISIRLSDLLQRIYDNSDKNNYYNNYLKLIEYDTHKPRKQLKIIASLILVANGFMSNDYIKCTMELTVNGQRVPLVKDLNQIEDESIIYKEIAKTLKTDILKGNVLLAILCGKVSLKIAYKLK